MQQCDSLILRTRGLWGLKDAVFDGDFGLLVLGYFGGSNLSGRMLRGHVSGDVNMGQTITVVRAGDGGWASEASRSVITPLSTRLWDDRAMLKRALRRPNEALGSSPIDRRPPIMGWVTSLQGPDGLRLGLAMRSDDSYLLVEALWPCS